MPGAFNLPPRTTPRLSLHNHWESGSAGHHCVAREHSWADLGAKAGWRRQGSNAVSSSLTTIKKS